MTDEINIENVIEGCRHQEQYYQKELYMFCFPGMMKICLRYTKNMDDAAACYNTAMLKVFSKIHQYIGDGPFLGWIRTIVVNTCITELKKKAKFINRPVDDIPETHLPVTDFDDVITAKEILEMVQELPATHSIVFNMHVMEGFNHDEIGMHLGISAGTSKWYLHEARKILKQKIKQFYYNDANPKVI